MNRLSLFAIFILSAGPAIGQETCDFKPRANAGDVFTTSIQASEKIEYKPEG